MRAELVEARKNTARVSATKEDLANMREITIKKQKKWPTKEEVQRENPSSPYSSFKLVLHMANHAEYHVIISVDFYRHSISPSL